MIENLVSVTAAEYRRLFPKPLTAFSSVDFSMLNSAKADRIMFLAALDASGKALIGLIAGEREGVWRSPFSAPMAALSCNREVSIATVADFISRISSFLKPSPLRIVMPPRFVAPELLVKFDGSLINMADDVTADFNYHYDLSLYPDFEEHMKHNARKNYRRALKEDFTFGTATLARAYEVIRVNRTSKGYYLAMTLADLEATAGIIDIDSFVLQHGDIDVAAAIVYTIAPGIAHVVYWGDVPGYEPLRPMNILPFHIFGHYNRAGYRIVNIGPSSTGGVPNHGLCNFKESLGCSTSLITTATL